MPTALITGASRGLGRALALSLAPTHHIIACARTVGALEALDDDIKAVGGEATLAPLDITVPEAMQQLCRSIHDRWGGLNLWCHTAIHGAVLTPAPDMTEKDFTKCVDLNIRATQRLITYVAPLLGTAGQAVFFDDSHVGKPLYGHYASTKSAQIALAQAWAAENTNAGPKVKILRPNPMSTALRNRFYPGEPASTSAHPTAEAARLLPDILAS